MSIAIEIKGLKKQYGQFDALNGIDLKIPSGSFYGLLGPNGAGKTTTIGIITGLVKLGSGKVEVMGWDIIENFRRSRKLIGLASQEYNFDIFFSIEQILKFQAGYYGLSKSDAEENTDKVLKQFGLIDKRRNKPRELSGGMKRRLQIAKALVHDPPILILDEPTAGVDIELRHMLWDYLQKINSDGKTILLTTHYIEEAEKLCDNVAIIDSGLIVKEDTPDRLISDMGTHQIVLTVPGIDKNIVKLEKFEHSIKDDTVVIQSIEPEKDLALLSELIRAKSYSITEIDIRRSSLEDIFLDLTKGNANG
tara:strand:+ start:1112 stop:2032 length:921 start_codon:yes stop_codon:yes gene_type:complete